MATLTIRIDDELEEDLEKLAKALNRSKSELAREMLRKRIAIEQFRALRRKALLAEAAGYPTRMCSATFREGLPGHQCAGERDWPARALRACSGSLTGP